jgi:hypothetical protein
MGDDPFFGAHGGDGLLVPIKASVFSPVREFTTPCFASEDGTPKILVKFPFVPAGLEQARVLPMNSSEE